MIIIMPMSGKGQRFADVGITTPKPLIEVKGQYMFELSLRKTFDITKASKLIFITSAEHEEKFGISEKIKERFGPNCICIPETTPTGAATSVALVKDFINTDEDIVINDCDGIIESNISDAIAKNFDAGIDGILSTANLPGDRFSFVRLNEQGFAVEVAEKKRISSHIITGMYYFRHGREFVKYATQMIETGKKVKNEFYMAPVYQEMIDAGKKIVIDECQKLWEFGTPESLKVFLEEYPG